MTIVHPGPFKFCQQWWSPFMTAIKGRPGDFHRFVNAEICHKSWCFLHILLFNVSSKDLCGLFLKRLISKGEKIRNFRHGSNFNCISRGPNTWLNSLFIYIFTKKAGASRKRKWDWVVRALDLQSEGSQFMSHVLI